MGDPVAQAVYTVAGRDDPSAGPESPRIIGPSESRWLPELQRGSTSSAMFLDVLHALYVNAAEVDGVHGV